MKFIRIAIVIFGAILVIFIIIKLLPDEKKNLIKDINNLKNAVEKEDVGTILNYFDKEYFDKRYLDFDGLKSTINEFLNNADSINIMMSGLKVWIDSAASRTIYAHCSLGLRVIAKYENEKVLVFGGVIQPASVKGYFRKQKENFRIYSADY
ncbi:MAG: hypothetical protein N3A65_04695 [candidate division WOR-3 bacterium]|nr:hypothetical protein [candidate division WOR-3 bacterium]